MGYCFKKKQKKTSIIQSHGEEVIGGKGMEKLYIVLGLNSKKKWQLGRVRRA
jgi:hypothetical protein